MKFRQLLDIANKSELPDRLRKMRQDALHAMICAVNGVLPEVLLPDKVHLTADALTVDDLSIDRESFSQLVLVGGGKATAGMCLSVMDVLADRVPFRGAINIPYHQPIAERIHGASPDCRVDVTFCNHPIPDAAGMRGVEKMLDLVAVSPQDAIILALISGGGSALMPLPADGITLDDKKTVNQVLLACGAGIDEINCIRKHLSRFKGGQLSALAHPRRVVSLILSDVVGNDLQTIASGPTVADATTFPDMAKIIAKYGIYENLPQSVQQRLADGLAGGIEETPKPGACVFEKTVNRIIGSAQSSAEEARQALIDRGYACEIFSSRLGGEARIQGARLADRLFEFRAVGVPAAFIGTGEFTVTLQGEGRGGRNQEMLAGFLKALQDGGRREARRFSWVVVSGAFDGIEGNSGAMGAIIDSDSLKRLQQKKIDIPEHLDRNNTRAVFAALDDLLVTGQTGTNVNDMTIILVHP